MTEFSLYQRLQTHGTLAESAKDIPDARFALPSTINWIRALAILVADLDVQFSTAKTFYADVQRRQLNEQEINTSCEQLLFSLNQIAALEALALVPNAADVARVAIVTWYYGVYGAASAMIAANDGSFQDNHTATAQQWDRQFATTRLAMAPFGDRVSSLVAANVEADLSHVRARGTHSLTVSPTDATEAWGCVAEYLSGTAKWEQWNVQERVKEQRDFKALSKTDFRSAAARSLRDAAFAKRGIAFLHEASRYRGKANYRDAIFLAYGRSVPSQLKDFVPDLAAVLKAFSCMAAAYTSKRMGREIWGAFLVDLEKKRAVSTSPGKLWS